MSTLTSIWQVVLEAAKLVTSNQVTFVNPSDKQNQIVRLMYVCSTGSTSAHFAGEGIDSCDMQDDCDVLDATSSSMWSMGPQGGSPNTTVAIINLSAVHTSSSTSEPLDPNDVLVAVNQTLMAMALPKRFHLRVVSINQNTPLSSAPNMPTDDDTAMAASAGGAECSQSLPFKAYLISDSRTNIKQITKALKTPKAGIYFEDRSIYAAHRVR